ncbi:MAG: hypothetical protein AAFR13_00360 [Pseudomonadota bacterium]
MMPQCTMATRRLWLTLVMVAAMLSSAFAQNIYEPARGTAERKAILDAVRPKIEAEMRGPVEFVVGRLRAQDGWAFAQLDPQRPGGTPINPAQTGWARDVDFMDGLTVWALMRRTERGWFLIDAITGPTDVAFLHWPDVYGAPRAIFGFPTGQ